MPDVSLRKANRDDMESLHIIRDEKLPKLHETRLKMQDEGLAEYLIAIKNNEPVGHVFVLFKSENPIWTCPLLQDLFVKATERKQGISKKILELTGQRLREAGYSEMGIEVETDEDWIRRYYESVGFKLDSGPNKTSWTEKDTGKKILSTSYFFKKGL
jgi:GNAT superfamily N-acetyltransferase